MKKIILGLFLFLSFGVFSFTQAATWVNGYTKSNGTYVQGYYRSEPNGLKYDNYSWSSGDDLYNDSYYSSGRSYDWYTPSYTWDDKYYTGYNYNIYNNDAKYNNPYISSYTNYYDNSDYDRESLNRSASCTISGFAADCY